MIQFNEEQLVKKYEALPPKLKEVIESSSVFEKVSQICQKYVLNDEDVQVLTSAIGLVILGLLPPHDLFQEINEYVEVNEKVLTEVIREINRQILFPLHEELEKLYRLSTHIEETVKIEEIKKPEPSSPPPIKTPEQEQKIEVKIPKATPVVPTPAPTINQPPVETETATGEPKPFVLHEEKPLGQEKTTPSRTFSFPFKIFPAKPKTETAPPVKARLEGLEESSQRVVHYSELRTPFEAADVSPQPQKEEIINLETFTRETKPETKPETKAEVKTDEKNQPKIDGNIVNLK